MADTVPTLFGLTPEAYQQQQAQAADRMALEYAKLTPMQQAQFAIGRGAYQLAGALGGALGAQDPMLQIISTRNAIAKQIDITNPESIMQGFQQLQQIGDVQGQLQLLQVAEVAKKRQEATLAQQQSRQAQAIARQAYVPGSQVMETFDESTVGTDALGPAQVAQTVAPRYDVSRVAAQLQALGPAGRAEYEAIMRVQEQAAKTEKQIAEARLKEAEARFAPEVQLAALRKAVADADVREAEAKFAPTVAEAAANKGTAEATTAQAAAAVAAPRAAAELEEKQATARRATIEADFAARLQQAGLDEKTWNIANLRSQISDRTKRLGIDQQVANATVADKLSSINSRLTDLPTDARKLINESATAAATSRLSATQFADLANRIQAAEGGKGVLTSASEWFARTTGRQDEWTQIRNEYTRLRNTVAIKSLPPGPATDKDITLALRGIPPENANAEVLSSFLRGLSKMQEIEASIANAKTDWLSQNKGLLTRVDKSIRVGDYVARPGESFEELSTRIAKDVNARFTGASEDGRRASLINQIPSGAPSGRSQAAVLNRADAIIQGGR